jgi:TorA maturation chaperone TorD
VLPYAKINDELSRAALFRAVALGFAYPLPNHVANVDSTLADLQIPNSYRKLQQIKLAQAIRHVQQALKTVEECHLESEYLHLFLTKTVCSMNETAYGDGRSSLGRSSVLADVSGFYSAFGLQATEKAPNLPDHLCSELEFYSLLLIKQAYAENQHWQEQRRITQRAAITFLREHLGCWTTAFTKALREQTATPILLRMADLLDIVISCECQLVKVRPVKLVGRITADEMQGEELICPRAT